MNIFEYLYNIKISEEYIENDSSYNIYTILPDNKFMFFTKREEHLIPMSTYKELNEDIHSLISSIYSCDSDYHIDYFIDYSFIEKILNIEIEFKDKVDYCTLMKYPLVTIMGKCSSLDCKVKIPSINGYALRGLNKCTDNKINWKFTIYKYPDIIDFLVTCIEWLIKCPNIDIIYTVHDFYEDENEIPNYFEYASFIVKNNKIIVISDKVEMEGYYNKYN